MFPVEDPMIILALKLDNQIIICMRSAEKGAQRVK